MRLTWYECGCFVAQGRSCELVAPPRCDVHRCERKATAEHFDGVLVLDARLRRYTWLPGWAWDGLPQRRGRAYGEPDVRGDLTLYGRIVDEHLVAEDLGRVPGAIGRPRGGRESMGEVWTV